jgi:hypothetical protein
MIPGLFCDLTKVNARKQRVKRDALLKISKMNDKDRVKECAK